MNDRRLLFLLAGAGVLGLFAACLLGTTPLTPGEVAAALIGGGSPGDRIVVQEIRLPRALAAFSVGAALGVSGAALQGLFRNPLAEPGILGVSASAALGATVVIYYGLASAWIWAIPTAAVTGALAATALLAFAALRIRSVVTLILIGVGLSSLAGAVMSLVVNLAPNPFSLAEMINWTLGSVANRSYDDLLLAVPLMALGVILLFRSRRGLSVLTLGEEAASGVGLDLARHRGIVVAGAGLAAGAAVSLAGVIGFVGVVAPHIVRPFVGHDPARSLAPAGLLAGTALVFADIGVRMIPTPFELNLGVAAALIGAPAFIWIAIRRRAWGHT